MSNQNLYRKWVERYAERLRQPVATTSVVSDPVQQPSVTPSSFQFTREDFFFLEGAFGENIDKRVHEKYQNIPAIDTVRYNVQNKIVNGSNPFYVVAVNEVFQELYPSEEIWTATQGDLEQIVRSKPDMLRNNYEDSSLVWRSNTEPNKYLATKIYNQFKSTGKILEEGHAYVLPLNALSLQKDTNAPQGLAFKVRGNADHFPEIYFEAPILMSENGKYISDSDFAFRQGLP